MDKPELITASLTDVVGSNLLWGIHIKALVANVKLKCGSFNTVAPFLFCL